MVCRCFTNKFVVGALVLASLSLFSIPVSAQQVGWGNPANPAVPVPFGGIATIIEGVLLLVMGVYALYRKRGHFRIIAIVALTAGILVTGIGVHLMNEARALENGVVNLISIQTPFGTAGLNNGINEVRNDYTSTVTITKIDPEECALVVDQPLEKGIGTKNDLPICQVGMRLEPGASCLIVIFCGDGIV